MNERTRRRVLRSLGAAGLAGVAGCSGDGETADGAAGRGDGEATTPTADPTAPASTATTPTATLTAATTTAVTPSTAPPSTAAPTTTDGDPDPAGGHPLTTGGDAGPGDAALNADGTVAVVSESGANNANGTPTGAVFTYRRDGDDWRQVDALFPADLDTLAQFGIRVALSSDASTLLVVAPFTRPDAEDDVPVAYFYDRDGDGWRRAARFEIDHGGDDGTFGNDVDLAADGRLAVVGSHTDDEGTDDQGQVRVFRRGDDGWSRGARIVPDDGPDRESFGFSVAVAADPELVVVGAWDETYGDATGAAYAYRRAGGDWRREARPLGDGSLAGNTGMWVDLAADGETALVGVADGTSDGDGGALVYDRAGGDWRQAATLRTHDRVSSGPGDQLALADDGETAIVGQPLATDPNEPDDHVGQASVFRRQGDDWARTRRLVSGREATDDLLGWSTALSGDGSTAVVHRLQSPGEQKGVSAFAYDL